MKIFLFITFFIVLLSKSIECHDFPKVSTFKLIYQLITGELIGSKSKEKVDSKLKNGTSIYLDYVSYLDSQMCMLHEVYEADRRDSKKTKANCIRAKGNGTLHMLNGLSEVMHFLSGNANNKQEGNCAIILFYTRKSSCPGCLAVVPHYNSLARNFLDIKVGALDALEHSGLNSDFGIIGLPSIILFQGSRMILKFNITQQATVTNLVNFIQSYTNLKASSSNIFVTSDDFSNPLRIQQDNFDPYLILSWVFIIVCAIYYFTRSNTYKSIVEFINRAWRESNEAIQ